MRLTPSRLGRWILSAAVIVLLIVFATKVEWHATWLAIRGANPYLIVLAATINLASLLLRGVRWWVFIRPIAPASLGLALRATLAGAGLNNILVANGGEAARVVFVTRATGASSARILASLAVERLFDLMLFIGLLALAAFVLPLPFDATPWRIPAAAGLIAVLLLCVYLIRKPAAAPAVAAAGAIGGVVAPTLRQRLRNYGDLFVSGVATLSTTPRFLGAIALSVLAWVLQIYCYHVTAIAADFPISLAGTVAAVLAVNLSMALRPTPGSVGVFQLMYAITAVSLGLPRDEAVAVGFLIQALQTIPITLLGVALAPEFVFRRRRAAVSHA